MSGELIISLDFELHWGLRDHSSLDSVGQRLRNVDLAVRGMLVEFERRQIHATWAVVGLLMAEDADEALRMAPPAELRPTYAEPALDPYPTLEGPNVRRYPECYFAPALVEAIRSQPGQEVGSHTYSHYYCLEEGQRPEQFEADLLAARRIASQRGMRLKSLVFPRNQMGLGTVDVCAKQGFRAVRGNPRAWMYRAEHSDRSRVLKRVARLVDAHFPLVAFDRVAGDPRRTGRLWNLPASRLLRAGFSGPSRTFCDRRIVKELESAARHGRTYHLWWHPHNFGDDPRRSAEHLGVLLDHFVHLRRRFGMRSVTMSEAVVRREEAAE